MIYIRCIQSLFGQLPHHSPVDIAWWLVGANTFDNFVDVGINVDARGMIGERVK